MKLKIDTINNINWFFNIAKISKKPIYILIFNNIILGMYFAVSALILRKLVNGASSKNKEVLYIYTFVFIAFIISKIIISAISESNFVSESIQSRLCIPFRISIICDIKPKQRTLTK